MWSEKWPNKLKRWMTYMIKIYFEYVNDNGEWEKTSLPCESMAHARLMEKTINKTDRKRNPQIIIK